MPLLTGGDTGTTVDISLTLPDDEHLLAAVLGQLSFLTYPNNWEQHGTATPAQRADEMRTAIANLDHAPGGDMLVPADRIPDYFFIEEYASGVDAGAFTSGAWRDRKINVMAVNRDSEASVTANKFSVPTGTYWIQAFATSFQVASTALRVVEAITEDLVGTHRQTAPRSVSSAAHTDAITDLWLRADLSSDDEYKLQHRCATTKAINGMGRASTWMFWVASGLMLWRVE